MAADSFWNNREAAQKIIDEGSALRKRIDPLLAAEKHFDDLQVMLELAEGEPADQQAKHEQELNADLGKFARRLEDIELRVFLNGPHDKDRKSVV